MLVVLAARMLWCGWALHNVVGLALLIALALALSGLVPYVLEILVFPAHMVLGGLLGLAQYTRLLRRPSGRWNRSGRTEHSAAAGDVPGVQSCCSFWPIPIC